MKHREQDRPRANTERWRNMRLAAICDAALLIVEPESYSDVLTEILPDLGLSIKDAQARRHRQATEEI